MHALEYALVILSDAVKEKLVTETKMKEILLTLASAASQYQPPENEDVISEDYLELIRKLDAELTDRRRPKKS
jgi:hypothetical protein